MLPVWRGYLRFTVLLRNRMGVLFLPMHTHFVCQMSWALASGVEDGAVSRFLFTVKVRRCRFVPADPDTVAVVSFTRWIWGGDKGPLVVRYSALLGKLLGVSNATAAAPSPRRKPPPASGPK